MTVSSATEQPVSDGATTAGERLLTEWVRGRFTKTQPIYAPDLEEFAAEIDSRTDLRSELQFFLNWLQIQNPKGRADLVGEYLEQRKWR